MNRRDIEGKYAKPHSPGYIISVWVGSLLSLGLLYLAGTAVMADFAQFRSCSSNDAGLKLVSCGKQSANLGDIILVGLFILAAVLVVTLFTAAWRTVRRRG